MEPNTDGIGDVAGHRYRASRTGNAIDQGLLKTIKTLRIATTELAITQMNAIGSRLVDAHQSAPPTRFVKLRRIVASQRRQRIEQHATRPVRRAAQDQRDLLTGVPAQQA